MSWFEHKIPPPIIGIICVGIIWAISTYAPGPLYKSSVLTYLAILIAGFGLLIDLVSMQNFRSAKTTVNPLKPEKANALVVAGFYKYTRNPMYVGMLFILTGWALYRGHPASILAVAGFVLYMNRFQIIPEERAMLKNFGTDYQDYKKRVRRWL